MEQIHTTTRYVQRFGYEVLLLKAVEVAGGGKLTGLLLEDGETLVERGERRLRRRLQQQQVAVGATRRCPRRRQRLSPHSNVTVLQP